MSRQKRESRSQKEMVYFHPAHFALSFCAIFSGVTAPLAAVVKSLLTRLATNFLHSDQPHRHTAQLAFAAVHSGLPSGPPPGSPARFAAFGIPVSPRSSLPLIPDSRRLLARQ